jgi:gliding motility-associated-like protein
MVKLLHIFFVVLLMIPGSLFATHIVGGEFELVHLEDFRYQVRLIIYFDEVNGNPGAKDPSATASIFRQSDDVFMRNVTLNLTEETFVPYTNPICADDRLVTSRLLYEATIELGSDTYNDPEGYYLVWERCCRNNIITNITNPESTGQTFLLDFPPVVKNGEPFINSTPQLFPPLSDYACVNQLYYVDFRGQDVDGDSLVYSLVDPLKGASSPDDPAPPASRKPYATVNWTSGIGINNQVPGNPPLRIDKNGFLTVTPDREGLFVFSVLCEEYRDGVKLGEVRRDFQMLVIDCPDPGFKPVIKSKKEGETVFKEDADTLVFSFAETKCIDFIVLDNDGNENMSVRAVPVNFEASIDGLFNIDGGIIQDPEDSLSFKMCLPDCPYLENEPYIIDVIALDETCPLPLQDTMRLTIIAEPPPNFDPEFTQPINTFNTRNVAEGTVINLPIRGEDQDNELINYEITGIDFDISSYPIGINTITNTSGEIQLELNWDTNCLENDFSEQTSFTFMMTIEDEDACLFNHADTLFYTINIELPPNNLPAVKVNNRNEERNVSVRVGEELKLNILGEDADLTDLLSLKLRSDSADLELLNINFPDLEGRSDLSQTFRWLPDCDLVSPEDSVLEFSAYFIIEDFDKCKLPNADSVKVNFTVLPPLNVRPNIFINGEQNLREIEVEVGDELILPIIGFDNFGDSLHLYLEDQEAWEGLFEFSEVRGKEQVDTELRWPIICENLGEDLSGQTYELNFIIDDFNCYAPKNNAMPLSIVVKDKSVDQEIKIPNVFTPNLDDTINRYFRVEKIPEDNCNVQFQEVIIVNRWGKTVFRSDDPAFKWDGSTHSAGTYFYTIVFSDRNVKGFVDIHK